MRTYPQQNVAHIGLKLCTNVENIIKREAVAGVAGCIKNHLEFGGAIILPKYTMMWDKGV